jgi:hypothetical protein
MVCIANIVPYSSRVMARCIMEEFLSPRNSRISPAYAFRLNSASLT